MNDKLKKDRRKGIKRYSVVSWYQIEDHKDRYIKANYLEISLFLFGYFFSWLSVSLRSLNTNQKISVMGIIVAIILALLGFYLQYNCA